MVYKVQFGRERWHGRRNIRLLVEVAAVFITRKFTPGGQQIAYSRIRDVVGRVRADCVLKRRFRRSPSLRSEYYCVGAIGKDGQRKRDSQGNRRGWTGHYSDERE